MSANDKSAATILVASDNVDDAALVKRLLDEEFDHVITATNPEKASEDFARAQPVVLVLAFNTLERSASYYQQLYQDACVVQQRAHRNIVLCTKDEIRQAYLCCRDGDFDDYVLFWPLSYDASRLTMAVHSALRELSDELGGRPAAAEFAAPARQLQELGVMLARLLAAAEQPVAAEDPAAGGTGTGFDKPATDRLLRELDVGEAEEGGAVLTRLEDSVGRLRAAISENPGNPLISSLLPLLEWLEALQRTGRAHLETINALGTLAETLPPKILLVDDDEFQRKVVSRILKQQNYELVYAASGVDALKLLRKFRPELILMDIEMPGMDGLEAVAQIKNTPWLAAIPVIMLTGKGDKETVVKSKLSGAVEFIVKPFQPATLMAKVTHALNAGAMSRGVRR